MKHSLTLGQTMNMQEFSYSAPTSPNRLVENDEKVNKMKIEEEYESFDTNTKSGDQSAIDHDIQLLGDSASAVGNILARRESLDELIEDLEINSDIVKQD